MITRQTKNTVFALAYAAVVIGLGVTETACIDKPRTYHLDCEKEREQQIFLACLDKMPHGPEHIAAAGNDWDEAVEEMIQECRLSASQIACVRVWDDTGKP